MTARIEQNVVARRRTHKVNFNNSYSRSLQRGSANQTTMGIALGLTTLIFVSLLGFFYLQQVLSTAAQGSDIHALESQLIELREKQRALELKGAELRSINTIESKIKKLNLVNTEQVSYLAPQGDDKVASITD